MLWQIVLSLAVILSAVTGFDFSYVHIYIYIYVQQKQDDIVMEIYQKSHQNCPQNYGIQTGQYYPDELTHYFHRYLDMNAPRCPDQHTA